MNVPPQPKLAVAVGSQAKPKNQQIIIQNVYDIYKLHMSGKTIRTAAGEIVYLADENFPHWIKLEWFNQALNRWEDAKATVVIPKLEARILVEEEYRVADIRRVDALRYIPNLLRNPDKVCKTDNGDYVYIQKFKSCFKVAITRTSPKTKQRILVSSHQKNRVTQYSNHEIIYTKQ